MNMELFFGLLSGLLAIACMVIHKVKSHALWTYKEHVQELTCKLETDIVAAWGFDVKVDIPEGLDENGNLVAAHQEVQRQLINPEFVKQWGAFKGSL